MQIEESDLLAMKALQWKVVRGRRPGRQGWELVAEDATDVLTALAMAKISVRLYRTVAFVAAMTEHEGWVVAVTLLPHRVRDADGVVRHTSRMIVG